MKKITLILGLIAAVITLSCSKESAPSVVGKWHFYTDGAKGSGTTIVWATNTDDACEAQSFEQYNADGSIYSESYSVNTQTNVCELQSNAPSSFSSTWRKEGDDLIFTYVDDSTTPPTTGESKFHIVSLSGSELIGQVYDMDNITLVDTYIKLIRK